MEEKEGFIPFEELNKIFGKPVMYENTSNEARTIGEQMGKAAMWEIQAKMDHVKKGLCLFIKLPS